LIAPAAKTDDFGVEPPVLRKHGKFEDFNPERRNAVDRFRREAPTETKLERRAGNPIIGS
jgi:hypothetical protein